MRILPVTSIQRLVQPLRTCSASTGNFQLDFPLRVVVQTGSSLTMPVRPTPDGSVSREGMAGADSVTVDAALAHPRTRIVTKINKVEGSFGVRARIKQAVAEKSNIIWLTGNVRPKPVPMRKKIAIPVRGRGGSMVMGLLLF